MDKWQVVTVARQAVVVLADDAVDGQPVAFDPTDRLQRMADALVEGQEEGALHEAYIAAGMSPMLAELPRSRRR